MNKIQLIPLMILIVLSYQSFAQEKQEEDTTRTRFVQKLKMDPADTAKLDTTKVVTAEYSQETKGAQFQVRFKGFVKLNTFYDFEGMRSTEGFNPFDIVQDSALNRQLQGFYIGARQSRIGFESSIITPIGLIETYIEGDFAGDNTGFAFRLRHAYGKVQYFTIGQTWSTFTDLESIPLTVDKDGPNSGTFVRQGLIRFEKKFKENAEFGVSIENPLKDFFNPFDSSGVDFQRDGDFIGRLKMRHRKGHIQFAAVSRLISFTNVFGNKDFKGGFGAMISGTHAIYEKGKFLYNGLGGKGISRYIGGLEGKGQDAYPNAEGSFDLIPVIAATFAYEQLWTDQLVSTIIFGFTNLFTTESQPDEQFDNNQYISVNTFYNILSNLQIGFEFSWGDRQNKDGNTQDASRLQLMAKFDF